MRSPSIDRRGAARLELLLVIAAVVLALQLYPTLAIQLVMSLDLRTWTPRIWFSAFAAAFSLLCLIRFGPEVMEGFRTQSSGKAKHGKRRSDRDTTKKQLSEKEERQLYERTIEARKRQII